MPEPTDDKRLSAASEEDLKHELAQRKRVGLSRTEDWYCTTATRGNFRIFWKDPYDGEMGRHTDGEQREWPSFEAAREYVVDELRRNPHVSICYYIFDDMGRQLAYDCASNYR